MKLQNKLTLFNTSSKLAIVILFILLLPKLIENINKVYTDNRLRKQRDRFMQIVKERGISNYIQDGASYGSYLPLHEDYISLDVDTLPEMLDNISNGSRAFPDDKDTLEYRILSHNFIINKKKYLLEIGRSVNTISETSTPLQSIALQVLLGMICLTILADLFYSRYVLKPLDKIIKTKLIGHKFPNFGIYKKVRTTTSDFQYLDESIHLMIKTIESTFQKEREFISNASHELMTPISILQSKIENMFDRDDVIDDVKVRLLEMQRILNRLKTITKTLLLISQIENEQFIKEDTISAATLLQEVYDEISIRLQEKDIKLDIDVPADALLTGINKFLLFNLFFNLINNAIKYNKESGTITISGEIQNGGLAITITDTGIGIPEEQLPLIFNRFKKLKQSLQQESFGLGLPIVKSIADFHHIDIRVTSTVNIGTSFILTFPDDIIKII